MSPNLASLIPAATPARSPSVGAASTATDGGAASSEDEGAGDASTDAGAPDICAVEVTAGTMWAVDDLTCLPGGCRGCTDAEGEVYSAALPAVSVPEARGDDTVTLGAWR